MNRTLCYLLLAVIIPNTIEVYAADDGAKAKKSVKVVKKESPIEDQTSDENNDENNIPQKEEPILHSVFETKSKKKKIGKSGKYWKCQSF